jgi:outer membrane protein assembly factor BamD
MLKLNSSTLGLTLSLILLLVGCSADKKDHYKGLSAEQIYVQAEKNISKDNYAEAAKDFEALEARYPYGQYADKAQLGLIKAYYKSNDAPLALAAAERFIRMYPRHPEVDYAYYMKGLITYDQNYSFAFRYLPLDKSARDPGHAYESFEAFKELLERYPNSQYAAEAKQRMIHLKNLMADHELQVAQFYIKRGAFLSAANRANFIVKNYDRTNAVPEALGIMVYAYRKLGMNKLADDALNTLRNNFPNSDALKENL